MKGAVKIVFGVVGAVLALLLVLAIAATVLIDPNDYRDTISATVKEQTGRTLSIDGEIKLSLFPWLGLELGRMELGNAKGFAAVPFARIEEAEARVKLLPLLMLRTEIDTVLLRGLEVNLQRRADGVSNWDDLAKGPAAAKGGAPKADEKVDGGEPEGGGAPLLAALAIGGIVIENANVDWRDDQNNKHFTLKQFNFNSGEIRLGEAIPMELSAELTSTAPAVTGSVRFSGDVTAGTQLKRFALDGIELSAAVNGDVVPGGKLALDVGGDAAVDLAAQTASLSDFVLNTLGVELRLSAKGEQILAEPRFSGELGTNEFVPRQLFKQLAIQMPAMADPAVLGKAKLNSQFSAGLDKVSLRDLALQLDDTRFGGSLSVARFAAPVVRYDLRLDQIDVDRYLPPPSKKADAGEGGGKTSQKKAGEAAPQLPLPLLRSLDIDGNFSVGNVKVMNLRSDTIVATLKAKKGKFQLHPLSANLYQGRYSGNLGFDVSGAVAKISLDEKLIGVQSGPLVKDFVGKEYISGEANFAAKMTASGLDPKAIRRSLNGTANVKFAEGSVNGINIGYQIRKAYAAYKGQPAPKEEKEATDFGSLSGSFQAKNGLLATRDLAAKNELLQVAGIGTVNLVTEALDLRLNTTLVQAGSDIAELKGATLPVTVKGSFSQPKVGVDIRSVLEARAKKAINKKKQELKEKAQQRLEQQLQDKLKNMLKF